MKKFIQTLRHRILFEVCELNFPKVNTDYEYEVDYFHVLVLFIHFKLLTASNEILYLHAYIINHSAECPDKTTINYDRVNWYAFRM